MFLQVSVWVLRLLEWEWVWVQQVPLPGQGLLLLVPAFVPFLVPALQIE